MNYDRRIFYFIGFGISFVYSESLVPLPPAKITTFIVSQLLKNNTLFGLSKIVSYSFFS